MPNSIHKPVFGIVFAIAIIAMLAGVVQAATFIVDDDGTADYTSIQAAINAANSGDIIEVHSGTYYENVNVNKQLSLQGVDNGGGKPVVDAERRGDGITISANGITLEGFTVTNARSSYGAGILVASNNNKIIDNTASNGVRIGIYLGKYPYRYSGNILSGNEVGNATYGIVVFQNDNNIISGNKVNNNHGGINLCLSNNNIITDNIVSNNNWPCTVTYNLVRSCKNNAIYHNNFINNKNNAGDLCVNTQWDNGYPSGGNYWSNYNGNDNFNGPNQDIPGSDGIGDTPHNIGGDVGAKDNCPLMGPWSEEQLPDLTLTRDDIFFDDNLPEIGQTVTISAKIHNIGEEDANDVIVQFFLGNPDNNNQIGSDKINSISAGGTDFAQISWTIERINDIYVIIDPFDDITESFEDNNVNNLVYVLTEFKPTENGFAFNNIPMKIGIVIGNFNIGYYCAGMSMAARCYFLHRTPLPTPGSPCNPRGDSIPPLECPTKKLIVLYQDVLYLDGVAENVASFLDYWDNPCRAEEEYSILRDSLYNNIPEVLVLSGHAVLAFGIIEDQQNQKQILIYDPNFPGHTLKITLTWDDDKNCFVMEPYEGYKDGKPVYYDRFTVFEHTLSQGIIGFSPVNLALEDPEGLVISNELNEITDAAYVVGEDFNDDGDPDDLIVISDLKPGYYKITVIPEPDAEDTDTYTLVVLTGDATIVLAEDIPISDIPDQPYVIESTEDGIEDKTPPAEPIPEFVTIAIPVAAILGLILIFRRRRHR